MEDPKHSDSLSGSNFTTTSSNHTLGLPSALTNTLNHVRYNPCALLLTLVALNLLLNRKGKTASLNVKKSGQRLQWLKVASTTVLVCLLSHQEMSRDQGESPHLENQPRDEMDNVDVILSSTSSFLPSAMSSYVLVVILVILEMVNVSRNMAVPVLVFWCSTLISLSATLVSKGVFNDFSANGMDIAHVGVVLFQCLVWLFTMSSGSKKRHGKPAVHPQTGTGWLNDTLLFWTLDLIWTAAKRTLRESDVPAIHDADRCRKGFSQFERYWKVEKYKRDLDSEMLSQESDEIDVGDEDAIQNSLNKHTPKSKEQKNVKDESVSRISLLKVLVQAFGFKFFLLQLIKGLFELAHFVGPVLMTYFMMYFQNRQNESTGKGVAIVLTIFAFNTLKTIFNHRIYCEIQRHQRYIRSSLILSVFNKALTIKNECTKDITTGEIVNLISHDCDRITNSCFRLFVLMSCPMMIIISVYLLYVQIGKAVFVSVFILLLLMPVNRFVGKKMKQLHTRINEVKDSRTRMINEIINGIKVLKLYAWEPSFIGRVRDIRNEDDAINASLSIVEASINGMFRAVPFLVKLAAFGTYLFLGGHIDAVKGFTTMHLFHMLNNPLNSLALLIPGFVEASTAIERICKFLNGENIPRDVVVRKRKGNSAIVIENGMFSWDRTAGGEPNLKNINIEIPKGSLVAVVGIVGSGKSSLLSAILGEMEKLEGDVEIQGRVAYVPQEAWILNATVRDNVLFGSQHKTRRYQQVISACALKEDIKTMTAGDKTEIGEKGINLSGGQKQRVSLARAGYSDADVYLLDDPLSAVDAHVGKHIFQKVIGHKGLLKNKTRVIVTHGIHWLPFVDSILVVKDGQISETGTYEQLTTYDGEFAQFARQVLSHNRETASSTVNKVRKHIFTRLSSLTEHQSSEYDSQADDIPTDEALSESSSDSNDGDKVDDDVTDGEPGVEKGVYVDEEDLEEGQIKTGVYLEYVKTVGYKLVALFSVMYCIASIFDFTNTDVVKQWTDDPTIANRSLSDTDEYVQTNWRYFTKFAVTGCVEVVMSFAYVLVILRGAFRAATRLHNKLLRRVLRCPMSFFNTTPSCRIISRFSKDVPRVDGLGNLLRHFICYFCNVWTFLAMLILYCPSICFTLIPISVAQCMLYAVHMGSLRQLRRFKSKHRSPMYTHFTAVLDGRASIRAYGCQKRFIKDMEDKIDTYNNFDLWEIWVSHGLSMKLILDYRVLELVTCLICVMDGSITAGMVGVITVYAGSFCDSLANLLRIMSVVETEIVSLEKVIDYSNKPSEAPWERDENKPALGWPADGRVVFDNYMARHHEDSALVLKGINCVIERGQKVGVVGRTGAGKTSLATALFRLFEASDGTIRIDDENIAQVGLHDLRSRINILPQEPVIFKGSLKMNLDPFDRCTDEEIWEALRHAHLASFVKSLTGKLEFECGEGGNNLSIGQRQLLCLARTLLRKTKILVLDEATAAVDMETDDLIQKTIRADFKDCTVLTIAHRLNTIVDYDKILVLDQGLVKEFDSPKVLLAKKDSMFYCLAKDSKLVE